MSTVNELEYSRHFFAEGLEKFVKYAWVMKSSAAKSQSDLLIADGYPELIFVIKGAYHKEILHAEKSATTISNSCVIGIQVNSVIAHRLDNCYLVGVKLHPWGAFQLLAEQLKKIGASNVSLDTLGVSWLSELDQKITAGIERSEMFKLLETTLHVQVNALKFTNQSELSYSYLATILGAKGKISVQELAEQHALSIRHFQRKFKDYYGLSPKKFINLIRFKALYKACVLQANKSLSFLDFGYYDQMHFIKDFRKQLGTTPSKSTEAAFLRLNEMARRNS